MPVPRDLSAGKGNGTVIVLLCVMAILSVTLIAFGPFLATSAQRKSEPITASEELYTITRGRTDSFIINLRVNNQPANLLDMAVKDLDNQGWKVLQAVITKTHHSFGSAVYVATEAWVRVEKKKG